MRSVRKVFHLAHAGLFCNLLALAGEAESPSAGDPESSIQITDEPLGAAVFRSAAALGRDVDVTAVRLVRGIWPVPIRDLTGIECLTRLESIDLRNQQVESLAPLAGQPELRSLNLSRNSLGSDFDIGPLLEMPKLRTLFLEGNSLDLSGPQGQVVANLRSRGVLVIDSPQTGDVFKDGTLETILRERIGKPEGELHAADFEGVTELDLSGRCVSDLSGLELAKDLERVTLRNSGISDSAGALEALSQLPKLAFLDVSGSFVNSIAPMIGAPSGLPTDLDLVESFFMNSIRTCDDEKNEEFKGLTDAWLTSSAATDPGTMRTLLLGNNKLRRLAGIERFISLEALSVPDNMITDVERLRMLPDIAWVDLRENDLDLSAESPARVTIELLRQRGATVLTEPQRPDGTVTLADQKIAERIRASLGISTQSPIGLRQLRTLTSLDLSDLGMLDLGGLEHAIGLTSLDLRGNFIRARAGEPDLAVLAELRSRSVSVDTKATFHHEFVERFPNPYLIENLFPGTGPALVTAQPDNVSVKFVSLIDDNVTVDLRGLETLSNLERITMFCGGWYDADHFCCVSRSARRNSGERRHHYDPVGSRFPSLEVTPTCNRRGESHSRRDCEARGIGCGRSGGRRRLEFCEQP